MELTSTKYSNPTIEIGPNDYYSPEHFSVAWSSSTELVLSSLGELLPTTDRFKGVWEFPTSGPAKLYTPDRFKFSYSDPNLTVTGANFASGSSFRVIVSGPDKGPGSREGSVSLKTGFVVTTAFKVLGSQISVEDNDYVKFFIELTYLGVTELQFKVTERIADGGTEYTGTTLFTSGNTIEMHYDVVRLSDISESVNFSFEVPLRGAPYIQLYVKGPGATGDLISVNYVLFKRYA